MKFKIALLPLVISFASNAQVIPSDIERIEVEFHPDKHSVVNSIKGNKVELSGQLLDQQKSGTLGDTLKSIPGMSSSFFGSSAGRPQIRGLSGHRVLISSNGVPIRDMSSVSDEQLVPIEPFFADNITVIKGAAATVVFGGEAMAGLVDVDDGRIPLQLNDSELTNKVELKTGFNTDSSFLGRFRGENRDFEYNINVLHREQGDYDIPGQAKDPRCTDWSTLVSNAVLQSQCQVVLSAPVWEYNGTKYVDATPVEDQVIDHRSENSDGKVNNSSHYQSNVTFGGSLDLEDDQLLGFAVGYNEANRGIPGYMHLASRGTDDIEKTGIIRINSTQYRVDGLYQKTFNESEFLDQFKLNLLYSKQRDDETLAGNSVNTFVLQNWQVNPTLNYIFSPNFSGVAGVKFESSKHFGEGIDDYLPNVGTDSRAAYILQDINFGDLSGQLGARYESVKYEPSFNESYNPGTGNGAAIQTREFDLNNYVASLRWDVTKHWWLNSSYTHAERAPAVNELYASNAHYALLIEEQGDSELATEVNKAFEYGTGLSFAGFSISANWYKNKYDDFIYLGDTGIERSGVYVKEWRQADTENKGLDVELSYTLPNTQLGEFTFTAFADKKENTPVYHFDGSYDPFSLDAFLNPDPAQEAEYFRRKLEGNSLPQTPADSQGLAVHWAYNNLSASLDYTHHSKQDKLAKNELESEGFHMIGAYFSVQQAILGYDSEIYLNVDNLTNEEARPHQSFLRFLTPLPGRSVAIGIRAKI